MQTECHLTSVVGLRPLHTSVTVKGIVKIVANLKMHLPAVTVDELVLYQA